MDAESADPRNHTVVRGYEPGFVEAHPKSDLEAYDRLPAVVRQALDHAPLPLSAVAAARVFRKEGEIAVLREISASADAWFAACEAETGVPRPRGELRVERRMRCRR